jgi:hypothetical protein
MKVTERGGIGVILCDIENSLHTKKLMPPIIGNVRNSATFDFPIIYKIAKGVLPDCIMKKKPDYDLVPIVVEAAKDLEEEGVSAITTSCGFFSAFQRQIANSVRVPVFTSSLLQLPIICNMLNDNQKIGVISANSAGLSAEHLRGAGAEAVPIVLTGIENLSEWRRHLDEGCCDLQKLRDEITEVGKKLVLQNPEIGAILLECTELPYFAYYIQKQTQRPVFCLYTLANFVHSGVVRKQLIDQETEI